MLPPQPEYAAIGSQDRFVCMYVLWDGSSPWVDDDAMTKSLREINRRVKLVAFGERSDSQFIVYDNWVLALSKCPCVIEEY